MWGVRDLTPLPELSGEVKIIIKNFKKFKYKCQVSPEACIDAVNF